MSKFRLFVIDHSRAFSSPEAGLLLVSTKNRDLWPGPTPEVRDSRTSRHSAHVQSQVWQMWLVLASIYFVYKAIQKRNVVGPGQSSRFLVLTKRSSASGDEDDSRGFWTIFCQISWNSNDWIVRNWQVSSKAIGVNLLPRAFVTLVRFAVPLDKGIEGSGDEIESVSIFWATAHALPLTGFLP